MRVAIVLLLLTVILWFMPAFLTALVLGALAVIGFMGFLLSLLLIFLYLLKYRVNRSNGMPFISVIGARLNSAQGFSIFTFLI